MSPLACKAASIPRYDGPYLYFENAVSGANLLTITAGHTLDLVEAVLGAITEVDARAETLWATPRVIDSDTLARREVPDHVDVLGKTALGAVFTADMVGGVPAEEARFRMLTITLRSLERDGMVKRTAYPTVPPKVEYELTALGHSLIKPLRVLAAWAQQNRPAIEAARARSNSSRR